MTSWFGNLDLAYKYSLVFGSLLLLTILAGFVKVIYDRRRLKNFAKKESLEAGQKEDQVELNQREKDEGDLFGVRAIEAGFYAGIPQSRPTSRANSFVGSPSMSTSTLVGGGGLDTPKINTHSMSSSVTSLPLAHMQGGNRDSETLGSNSPARRKSPPAIRLAPSEAEKSGRINHNAAVNMNLNVPPSPVHSRPPRSPTFGGSDSGDSDGQASPRSLSPRSATFRPDHYAPVPPQIPLPHHLRVSVQSGEETTKSQSASFNDASPYQSPGHSAPPSPAHPPQARLPTMPHAQQSLTELPQPERPSSPVRLLPQAYQPENHKRDASDASSLYSNHYKTNTHQHKSSNSSDLSYNNPFLDNLNRNSSSLGTSKEHSRQLSVSNSLLNPGTTAGKENSDPRLSEFYDAYYRHSQLGVASKAEAPKRPAQINVTQPTIAEVPSPLPSPNPSTSLVQSGVAL